MRHISISPSMSMSDRDESDDNSFTRNAVAKPLVPTNPPLRMMSAGRSRRVKKSGKRRKQDRPSSERRSAAAKNVMNELPGFLAVLLLVGLFVVVEMIFVDQLFLGPGGRIANLEVHVSTTNVFVSDIVEASLNRYRLDPGVELGRMIESGGGKVRGMLTKRQIKKNLKEVNEDEQQP